MTKFSFKYDYSEGCHPSILQALTETNFAQQEAYGHDDYCAEARLLIHQYLSCPDTSIFFVAGGTQANLVGIASLLRPHEAIISAKGGHIADHEAGAIEATGHKILTIPTVDGKLRPDDIAQVAAQNADGPHSVKPRLVYISNATETGRAYTKGELTALAAECAARGLLLFMDGARLGSALASEKSDLTLADITALTDMFWIGGTKAGALIGEAVIIPDPRLAEDFGYHIKQRGAMLAKSRLLGLQFRELFRSDLFFEVSRHANGLAQKLSASITAKGYALAGETETNQVFAIFPNAVIERLSREFDFHIWETYDAERSIIRLVTSWATQEAQVERFIEAL